MGLAAADREELVKLRREHRLAKVDSEVFTQAAERFARETALTQ
jgi:hypothetical protein